MVVCKEIWFWIRDFSLALYHSKLPKRPWSKKKKRNSSFLGEVYNHLFFMDSTVTSFKPQHFKEVPASANLSPTIFTAKVQYCNVYNPTATNWGACQYLGQKKFGGAQLKYVGILTNSSRKFGPNVYPIWLEHIFFPKGLVQAENYDVMFSVAERWINLCVEGTLWGGGSEKIVVEAVAVGLKHWK